MDPEAPLHPGEGPWRSLPTERGFRINAVRVKNVQECTVCTQYKYWMTLGWGCGPKHTPVHRANGQREPIAGIGTYGSITGARRVGKFPRTLVSVTDLIEQFGSVVFDTKGVHILTRVPGAGPLATTIGSRTASRLFSFDAPSLTVHAEALRSAGVGASDPEDLRPRLGTMGVRWSPVPNNGLSWASLDRLRGVAPVAAR